MERKEIDYVSIGKRIRQARVSRRWTQAVLAEKAGVEPSNISHIERGATKLSLPTLIRLANAMEVTADELVYGSLVKNAHLSLKMMEELLADCSPEELTALLEVLRATKNALRGKK